MSWTWLFIASLMEICWMYSLKALDFSKIKQAPWNEAFSNASPWLALLPLLGYIGFGLGNIYFFSQATKNIPMAVAFAVWTGLALVGAKLIDHFWFREGSNWLELLFMAMIVGGVIGLRTSSGNAPG